MAPKTPHKNKTRKKPKPTKSKTYTPKPAGNLEAKSASHFNELAQVVIYLCKGLTEMTQKASTTASGKNRDFQVLRRLLYRPLNTF